MSLPRKNICRLTTEQLTEKKKQTSKHPKLGSEDLLKKYIHPLINQEIINHVTSELDGRQNIYFPAVRNRDRHYLQLFFY